MSLPKILISCHFLITGGTLIDDLEGHVKMDAVTFSYPSRSQVTVLNDLTLEVTPGKILAVVGPSGSGKSTIASLLLRLYDPEQGTDIDVGNNLNFL